MSNSEKMNSQPETGANSFVDMAEQTPSFEEHMKQYKDEFPDAVENIDKARTMAEATNSLESRAARFDRAAQEDSEWSIHMSEKLHGLADEKVERVSDDFDYQSKQREALSQRLQQEETSGRVEDIDKARAMAEASDFQETRAAKINRLMNSENYSTDPDYFSRSMLERNYERSRKFANRHAEEAAHKYDKKHQTE